MKQNQPGIRWREKPITKAMNKIVLKNLAICLGISLALGSVNSPVSELFHEQVEAATQFQDDAKIRDYSRESVESLVNIGSIKGYPEDNTFRPQGTITRQEFLSMCVNACDPGLTKVNKAVVDAKNEIENGLSYYDDVVNFEGLKGLWSLDLIVGSQYLGVTTAFTDTGKGNVWTQPITRGEAADIMIHCIEELKGEKFEGSVQNDYDLEAMIGDWNEDLGSQRYQIAKLYALGIGHGDSNSRFNPKNNLTREDSAVLIYALTNPSKRDMSKVVKVEKKDPYAGVQAGTLNQSDADRREAVPGDTFVDANGKSTVLKVGKGGILGEGQPVATELGRYLPTLKTNVKDGTNFDRANCISKGVFGGLGASYVVNPETGEGHWSDEWDTIMDAYAAEITNPVDGQTYTAGLGGWCKMVHNMVGWSFYEPDWM